MELFRLHAFMVEPQRTSAMEAPAEGGGIDIGTEIRGALAQNMLAARFDERTVVDFRMDASMRYNEVREAIVNYGFRGHAAGDDAASYLARRLSMAMDRRSDPCLLILNALREDDRRQVLLWTFPRDRAFRLRTGDDGARIEILTDIFSQTSKLRKAAQFQGRNLRNQFLSGRALDFQANQVSRYVADFWIIRFLDCALGIRGDAGTRLLAGVLRQAYESCVDPSDQEQLYVCVLAIRQAARTRWSLRDCADEYLRGGAREAFLKAVPNRESVGSSFDVDRELFDSILRFRVFQLETGVYVSSPMSEVGQSVLITGAEDRHLSCEGAIVGDKLRRRHA